MRPLSAGLSGTILAAVIIALVVGMRRADEAQSTPDPYAALSKPVLTPGRVYSDAEVGIVSNGRTQQQEAAAEQVRQEQAELRERRAIYECMLRNAGRPNISESMLMAACTEFPDLGSSWFRR